MTSFLARAGLLTTCLLLGSWNDTTAQTPETPGLMRATSEMLTAPRTYPAEGFSAEGVEAVFYDGLPWKGKPTRVFAWIGAPKLQPGEKAPAIVLVHGGGGTAFDAWVRLWVSRGYVAISMDTCGTVPKGSYGKWERHDAGGPPGNDFNTSLERVADQWNYHAVADAILAHSLLRARPDVDIDRIGLTGISWGGYLTCIVSALDDRFKFAAPVYGCGFLGDNSVWKPEIEKLGDRGRRWLELWDPSHFLPLGKAPMLWVTGTNDFAYPLDSLRKSSRVAGGPSTLCVRLRMPHGHGPAGENPEEIHAFADSIIKGGKPLAEVSTIVRDGSTIRAAFAGQGPVASAQLLYTKADGPWTDRLWETADARVDQVAKTIDATLPTDATAYFLNVLDPQGRVVSTQLRIAEKTNR
jgi:dienelactone hydrolase